MPTEKYNSRKIIKTSDLGTMPGINNNSGPYVGIVKNNVDLLRSGRLQVYIPVIGGPDPDNPKSWIDCSYASPFFGHANLLSPTDSAAYDQVRQSYGFWMVPPDLGVRVLIIFADGDPNLAYWFACIPEPFVNHMVPAIGSRSPDRVDLQQATSEVKNIAQSRSTKTAYPTSEVNVRGNVDLASFYDGKRAIHEDMYKRLVAQGLDQDTVRGTVSSSSQRESPSNVMGFSSPGRPVKDIAAQANAESLLASGNGLEQYTGDGKKGRRGGHSLVFDDGDILGRDMLVRLRTARGHQILLHDTEDLIYISSANGKTWVELSADGQVQIYAAGSVSVRTEQDFNLHADGNINFNAGKNLNIHAKQDIKVESSSINARANGALNLHATGDLALKADGKIGIESVQNLGVTSAARVDLYASGIGLNSVKGPPGVTVQPLPKNRLPDSILQGRVYNSVPGQIETISPTAPTHEPYAGHPAAKSGSDRANIIRGS